MDCKKILEKNMDIGVPVKELGDIEVTPLIDAIMSINDEAWLANNHLSLIHI